MKAILVAGIKATLDAALKARGQSSEYSSGNGIVYAQIVPDVSARTLKSIIKQRVSKNSTIYSDSWKSCDGLVFYGYEHIRLNHDKELVDTNRNRINGIENFWPYIKNKPSKYYDIKLEYFYLYL